MPTPVYPKLSTNTLPLYLKYVGNSHAERNSHRESRAGATSAANHHLRNWQVAPARRSSIRIHRNIAFDYLSCRHSTLCFTENGSKNIFV